MNVTTRVLSSLLVSLLLAACGGGGAGGGGGTLAVTPATADLREGQTVGLAASNPGVVWSSADARVAVVDRQGEVCGCTPGTVTITARDPKGQTATAEVHVLPDDDFNETLPDDAAKLAPTYERKSGPTSCDVTIHLDGIAAHTRVHRYRRYHQLELVDASRTAHPGRPEIPYLKLLFARPVDAQTGEPAGFTVEVQRSDVRTYDKIRPWPHQPPAWIDGESADGRGGVAFTLDPGAYAGQEAYPQAVYSTRTTRCGDVDVLEVSVSPVRYLAQARRLELFRTTQVNVRFTGQGQLRDAAIAGDMSRTGRVGGDEWLADIVQNGDRVRRLGTSDLLAALPPLDLKGMADDPFDLLIVTRPALRDPAYRLAEWRHDEGTRVWLASLSATTYPDAESIRDFILTMDDLNRFECSGGERPHAMRAILIFGDAEIIPPCQGMNYRNGDDPDVNEAIMTVGTDLFYATLRGRDHHPDVAIGRISVDDADEGDDVVDKIIAYEAWPSAYRPESMATYGFFDDEPAERTLLPGTFTLTTDTSGNVVVDASGPSFTTFVGQVFPDDVVRGDNGNAANEADGSWWGRVTSVVSATRLRLDANWQPLGTSDPDGLQVAFQDGQDDWEFVKAAERVRGFMLGRGVPVRFGYTRRDGPTPTSLFEGMPLLPDLLTYAWDADTVLVQDNWHEGRDGIILHSDHGEVNGWWDPRFRSGDLVNILVPGGPSDPTWFPIVLSINCSSGWFDSETMTLRYRDAAGAPTKLIYARDPAAPTAWLPTGYRVPTHDECFCEEVLRHPLGGGVAAIGGARGTDAGKNDRLIDGLFAGFYADYREGCIPDGPGTRYAYDRLGDVVRAAKFRMGIWITTDGNYGDDAPGHADYNMEVYHLFGDPMLRVRPPGEPVLID